MRRQASRNDRSKTTAFRVGATLVLLSAVTVVASLRASCAETLSEALVKTYQNNPQLNAERARQRANDENVPQALAGYRPQIIASLSAGLQSVRNLLPDNTVQSASLRPWTIGVTVSQVLFNGFRTANSVRAAEFRVRSGREALRNVGQGVLLDAVTAYMNVLANQALVEAQQANVNFLKETLGITRKRLDAGDVTPTDTAQAEARLSRGTADLNAAEVALAVSKETYAQVIGQAPGSLIAAATVDRLSPKSLAEATETARAENPAVVAANYDLDMAQTSISIAESSLMPLVTVQGGASRSVETDLTLGTTRTDQASVIGQASVPIYDGGTAASQTRQAKELASQSRLVLEQVTNLTRTAVASAWVTNEGTKVARQHHQATRAGKNDISIHDSPTQHRHVDTMQELNDGHLSLMHMCRQQPLSAVER
jgi:outer membrane protein